MDVGGGGDRVHEVARHALGQVRSPDEQQDAGSVTGEEDRSLSRGVPPADEDHVPSPAAPSLDRRGPVRDPAALEVLQRRDRRTAVSRPRCDDDGARGDAPPILQLEGEWGSRCLARMCVEPACNSGYRESGSNFWAWVKPRPASSWPLTPVGKPK